MDKCMCITAALPSCEISKVKTLLITLHKEHFIEWRHICSLLSPHCKINTTYIICEKFGPAKICIAIFWAKIPCDLVGLKNVSDEPDSSTLEVDSTGYSETLPSNRLHGVTSRKNEVLIGLLEYSSASNHGQSQWRISASGGPSFSWSDSPKSLFLLGLYLRICFIVHMFCVISRCLTNPFLFSELL
jgi:hypothetical protein